mgnify:CR=1 FL=1
MGKFLPFLKDTDLFFNLTNSQLEMVESICVEQSFKKGEVIVVENTPGLELFLVLEGEVEVVVNPGLVSPDPKMLASPSEIKKMRREQTFGEIAIVDEGLRTASVRAASAKTRVLRIDRARLLMLCGSIPEMGYRVMHNLAVDLALKIRGADLTIREALLYKKAH